ncbi:heterokaryon incompatibility protein-domain-containing protein [Nemania sp. FL0916]|nr:heterokaryon incompatibility protein-domain-containing protein [Nemania sp. FL0916]
MGVPRFLESSTVKFQDENTTVYGEAHYAILSHRWIWPNTKEVLYGDMVQDNTDYRTKEGFPKLQGACDQAKKDKVKYVWADTCCINKKDAGEESMSINSMYEWYQNSQVCYAYLADVSPGGDPRAPKSQFRDSAWFERMWTLQELIAPREVVFFADDWSKIGTRETLADIIYEITRIPVEFLKGADPESASVAQRMSWASKRIATVTEDRAYGLMGIFGVNMPVLYGEGQKAFIRLQEEIIKKTDDHSIFAWKQLTDEEEKRDEKDKLDRENRRNDREGKPRKEHSKGPAMRQLSVQGLLAKSPEQFRDAHNIVHFQKWLGTKEFAMTNKGLHIWLPLRQDANPAAFLACQYQDNPEECIGIYVESLQGAGSQQFMRTKKTRLTSMNRLSTGSLFTSEMYFRQTALYVRGNVLSSNAAGAKPKQNIHLFDIYRVPALKQFDLKAVYPAEAKQTVDLIRVTTTPNNDSPTAVMDFQMRLSTAHFVVSVGVMGSEETAWCTVRDKSKDLKEEHAKSARSPGRAMLSPSRKKDTAILKAGLFPVATVVVDLVTNDQDKRHQLKITLL